MTRSDARCLCAQSFTPFWNLLTWLEEYGEADVMDGVYIYMGTLLRCSGAEGRSQSVYIWSTG